MSDRRPLRSLRVLDLTRLLPGPYLGVLLGDLGADVVKVEPPAGGDFLRCLPSPRGKAGPSAEHAALNRGKRSIALDLKRPGGAGVLRRLACRADVLLESFRPGVMQRLGTGWDVLHADNPRLVYVAITGYGQSGPYAHRAGHDLNYTALSGCTAVRGRAGQPPAIAGYQLADIGGALFGAVGALAAVLAARETGEGRLCDVSMTEGATAFLALGMATGLDAGAWPARGAGPLSGGAHCYGLYETADGRHVSLAALEPKFWAAFCEAVERPDWKRRQHAGGRMGEELAALFRSRTRDEWERIFATADACVEPVLEPGEVACHPQHAARRLFFDLRQGGATIPQMRTPLLDPDDAFRLGPAPALGEHTVEVLREAGYAEPEIEALVASGTVASART